MAAPGLDQHLRVRNRRVPGRLRDQAIFVDHRRGRGQLARENVGSSDEVEREPQLHERARLAGDLYLTGGQVVPGLGVPQLEGRGRAGSGTGGPEPAADLVGVDLRSEDELECSGEQGRGGCVSLRQARRERVEQ